MSTPKNNQSKQRLSWKGVLFAVITHLLVFIIGRIVNALIAARRGARNPETPRLLIGAGKKGWELIEYQEIYRSACEYLGEANVAQVAFTSVTEMLSELEKALAIERPTHYYFDPRSGSQNWVRGVWEAIRISVLLERRGITPICALTDFPVLRWRLQTALVSARRGVVTSLMSPLIIGPYFPHSRIIGPMPFPLSTKTLKDLKIRRVSTTSAKKSSPTDVVFVGLLYEPRKSTIETIQAGLMERGIAMKIIGRSANGNRISTDDYWDVLSRAKIVVATSSQISGKHTDFDGHNHLVYKFIEVTAAGALLAIEPVPVAEEILVPNADFLAFNSAGDAVEKISGILKTPEKLKNVAESGHRKASQLIQQHYYWQKVFEYVDDAG